MDELRFTNTPNILTSIRIAMAPVMVALLFYKEFNYDVAAALVFAAASITDFFDGYIARSQKLVTIYGKLMDPLADKFLVVSALIMLQYLGRIHPVIVILLICRELGVTGLRAIASAEGLIIAASPSAKLKTVSQMVAIPLMMVNPGLFGIPLFKIGEVLIYISLAISLWSAREYVIGFFAAIRARRRKKNSKKPYRDQRTS